VCVCVCVCVCVLSAGSGVDIVSQQSLAERLEVVHSYVHDDNDNDSESASDNSEDASSIASLGGSEENLPKVTYRPHTRTYVWDHVLSWTV